MAKRKAREASPAYLERVALWYMERYPASVARVRRTLQKRVARSVDELGTDPELGQRAVDEVIAKLQRMRLLDDEALASARVRVLRARGLSRRKIQATLRHQGIASHVVDAALAETTDSDELEAARTFVRKRRLGRARPDEDAEQHRNKRQKELARLARGGFSFAVARQALDEALQEGADQLNHDKLAVGPETGTA